MPTYDITRADFLPNKHYTSVRMQQGKVLTDQDWNEMARIGDERERREQVDIIGRYGSPDLGFRIENLSTAGGLIDFRIHHGTIYLGGIRLEMDKTETFLLQSDWLQHDPAAEKVPFVNSGESSYAIVYLETWQQPVCAVEDSSLFEPALGGPDTTVRVRNMRRVRMAHSTSDECAIAWKELHSGWQSDHLGIINSDNELITSARLKVSFTDSGTNDDPCSPNIAGGYLGAENQSIRIQIINYNPSTNKGTFTWGYDNAAPLYRVSLQPNNNIQMITEPKDQYHWPLSGQVIELLPWSAVLPNNEKMATQSGFLTKVATSYDPDNGRFTTSAALPANFGTNWTGRSDQPALAKGGSYYYMRVWNRGADNSPEAIEFIPGTKVALGNTGLEITFSGNDFTCPDTEAGYTWVIAARPSIAKELSIIPWELTNLPTGIAPHGLRHYYAPLAIIRFSGNFNQGVDAKIIHDCRRQFRPLTEQECCCTYTVGDGITSRGDFNSIQDAINSLPEDGGKICVLRGIHEANVLIDHRQKIQIVGCGDQSIVRTPDNNNSPIFLIRHSQGIKIEQLTLVAIEGVAIKIEDREEKSDSTEMLTIKDNKILALVNGIHIYLQDFKAGDNHIEIIHNLIGMYDKVSGKPAIFCLADGVLIERNRIVMIPPPPPDDNDPGPRPPDEPFDPCARLKNLYALRSKFLKIVHLSLHFIGTTVPTAPAQSGGGTGGIQIGGGSERVSIALNDIIGGAGNGILLGHNFLEYKDMLSTHVLYEIEILRNRIQYMGRSGIASYFSPNQAKRDTISHIDNLTIESNTIRNCVQTVVRIGLKTAPEFLPAAGIALASCSDCTTNQNRIEDNGKQQPEPVSGIYIYFTDKVDISNNRILNNGIDNPPRESALNTIIKGGIVIWFAVKTPRLQLPETVVGINNHFGAALFPRIKTYDADPVAKVHDNIVDQPVGQALFLVAIGPVSVVSNQFSSQGINKSDVYSKLAGTVYILNLGISKDFPLILLLPINQWKYVNPVLLGMAAAGNASINTAFFNFLNFPDGKIMFAANQVLLDMKSPDNDLSLSSIMLFSLDDIAFVNNQSECAAFVRPGSKLHPVALDMTFFNTILLAVSTRSSDNRFTDGFSLVLFSLLSKAFISTAVNNQATHCLVVPTLVYRIKEHNIELQGSVCKLILLELLLSHN